MKTLYGGDRQSGFTLIELIIVIVVIAILAAITITVFSGVRNNALRASMQTDARQAYSIMANYNAENGYYTLSALTDAKYKPSGNNVVNSSQSGIGSTAVWTITVTNPALSDSYVVDMGATTVPPIPRLQTNPYINSPQAGAMYETGWCGPPPYYIDLVSVGGGTPTPTYQWQIMSPKNSTTGSWSNISGGTTANYQYTATGINFGDYVMFRVNYTTNGTTKNSPPLRMDATNGC